LKELSVLPQHKRTKKIQPTYLDDCDCFHSAWVDIAIPNQTTTMVAGVRKAENKTTKVVTTTTVTVADAVAVTAIIAVFFRISKKILMVTTTTIIAVVAADLDVWRAVVVVVVVVMIGGPAVVIARTILRTVITIPMLRRRNQNRKNKSATNPPHRIEKNERDPTTLEHGPVLVPVPEMTTMIQKTVMHPIYTIYTTWQNERSIDREAIVVSQDPTTINLDQGPVLEVSIQIHSHIQTAIIPIYTTWQNAHSIGLVVVLGAIVTLDRLEKTNEARRTVVVATFHRKSNEYETSKRIRPSARTKNPKVGVLVMMHYDRPAISETRLTGALLESRHRSPISCSRQNPGLVNH
jgi:hypothetical protein